VKTTVNPIYLVKKASAAKATERKNERDLPLSKYSPIANIKRDTNNMKSGSVQANIDTFISGGDNKIESNPRNIKGIFFMFFIIQKPATNIINPKEMAFIYLATSRGLNPASPKDANKVGKRGGQDTKGLPSKRVYPLPDTRFSAVDA